MINYEEGAENNVLHGDAGSESLLTEFGFAQSHPGQRYLPVESMYEFGSRAGFWRLHRLFTSAGIPVTVNGVAMALERNPAAVAAMVEAGWEISCHGYRWIDYHGMPESEEREHLRKAIEIQTAVSGSRPLGCFIGRRSENTVRLVAEEGGFVYSQDSYADDLPYWLTDVEPPLLMVPYTADVNDHRFATAARLQLGRAFLRLRARRVRRALLGGRRGAEALERWPPLPDGGPRRPLRRTHPALWNTCRAHDRVWFCRGIDVARHWQERFPPEEEPLDG